MVFKPARSHPSPHVAGNKNHTTLISRVRHLERELIRHGNFESDLIFDAIHRGDVKAIEAIAAWARIQLARIRAAQKPGGRGARTLEPSLPTISDLAVTLMESLEDPPGLELIALMRELLDVDAHRKLHERRVEIEFRFDAAAEREARSSLQGKELGVRALAKSMGVAPATITKWRKSKQFQAAVAYYRRHHPYG